MYLTVFNKKGMSVPFIFNEFGEIQVRSSNPLDDEDSCVVKLTAQFYEHSLDFGNQYRKV